MSSCSMPRSWMHLCNSNHRVARVFRAPIDDRFIRNQGRRSIHPGSQTEGVLWHSMALNVCLFHCSIFIHRYFFPYHRTLRHPNSGSSRRCRCYNSCRSWYCTIYDNHIQDRIIQQTWWTGWMEDSIVPGNRQSVENFVVGTLPILGRFYLSDILFSPVMSLNALVAGMLSSSVSPQYQAVALVADVAFQNTMACRVFRLLRLGILQDKLRTTTYSEVFLSIITVSPWCSATAGQIF